jgi:hypothetical protein
MLGVPVDGTMQVFNDHTTTKGVFAGTAQQDDVERAMPRSEDALKANWMRLTSMTSTNKVYFWYKWTQEQALAYGIPLMSFRVIVLQNNTHGLYKPVLGLTMYGTFRRILCDILRICMPYDASENVNSICELQSCYMNRFEFLWYVLKVVVIMMDMHISPRQS